MLIKQAIHEEIEKMPIEYLGVVFEQIKTLGLQTKAMSNPGQSIPTLEQVHLVTSKIKHNWSDEISQEREERF